MLTPNLENISFISAVKKQVSLISGVDVLSQGWIDFSNRFDKFGPRLFEELGALYGQQAGYSAFLVDLIKVAYQSYQVRPSDLKALDIQRENHPRWFHSQKMLGGVCYIDLFA